MSSAFWDTSALIPLCLREPTTAQVTSLALQYDAIVWWATVVEMRGAVARVYRANAIDASTAQTARKAIAELSLGWRQILPSQSVRDQAGELVDRYPLRAADALQLAAALIWCQQRPAGRTFISGDIRLCDAAELAGFTLIRLGIATP